MGASPDQSAAQRCSQSEPAERPARSARHKTKTRHRTCGGYAEEHFPLEIGAEPEPGGNPGAEANDEPGWELGTLRLEETFQSLVSRGKPRLPIAPSTLWKRRFPYVRGARPLHCSISLSGKRPKAQAEKI